VREADDEEVRERRLGMNMGMLFYLIAAIILFLAGIGATVIPNAIIWGLFCIALGLLLGGVAFPRRAS
jgi:hypothetical protein